MNTRSLGSFALVAFGTFGVALLALHALQSEYNPAVHFVSEYALGPFGWVQTIGSVAKALGTLALLGALASVGLAPARSAPFVLLTINVAMRLTTSVFPVDPIEAAFAGGGAPQFTPSGWIHAIAGMVAAVSLMLAIVFLTVRLLRAGRLKGAYQSLVLLCVLSPVFYVAMLATRPATFPAGLYQRLFIASTWLWLVVGCSGLMSGTLAGVAKGREPEGG